MSVIKSLNSSSTTPANLTNAANLASAANKAGASAAAARSGNEFSNAASRFVRQTLNKQQQSRQLLSRQTANHAAQGTHGGSHKEAERAREEDKRERAKPNAPHADGAHEPLHYAFHRAEQQHSGTGDENQGEHGGHEGQGQQQGGQQQSGQQHRQQQDGNAEAGPLNAKAITVLAPVTARAHAMPGAAPDTASLRGQTYQTNRVRNGYDMVVRPNAEDRQRYSALKAQESKLRLEAFNAHRHKMREFPKPTAFGQEYVNQAKISRGLMTFLSKIGEEHFRVLLTFRQRFASMFA